MKQPKMSGEFCLALDLAKYSAVAAIAPMGAAQSEWKTFWTHAIEARPESPQAIADLLAWVRASTHRTALCKRVVVEATGNISKRFVRALNAKKRLPLAHIVNPARSKAYLVSIGARNKTDQVDAACLALYGARCELAPPREPSAQEERLCELSRLREALVENRTTWKNRLGEACDAIVRQHVEQCVAAADQTIARVERDIRRLLDGDKVLGQQVRWLQQIHGIGPVTALTITAELGDLRDYTRGQIVAAAGLFPKVHESGTSVRRRPRLAKGAGCHIRRTLYMAATSLLKSKSPLRQYLARIIENGKTKMCALAAAMRKMLLIARAVIKAGGLYRPELIANSTAVQQKGALPMK
jgi:transposase